VKAATSKPTSTTEPAAVVDGAPALAAGSPVAMTVRQSISRRQALGEMSLEFSSEHFILVDPSLPGLLTR
jgi:hypothetical protein